jgi:hypothetical protein
MAYVHTVKTASGAIAVRIVWSSRRDSRHIGAGVRSCTRRDEVFRDLVLAMIVEPTSKADALRVLAETGVESVFYRTVKRRLRLIVKTAVRQALLAACAARAGSGPASDYQACSNKGPDLLQRREFPQRVHPHSDYPTLPACPGWPAVGAA